LLGSGGLAWRIGRLLGVPVAGWALGGDVRSPAGSTHGRSVAASLRRLDLVYYQSHDLMETAEKLAGHPLRAGRHFVLPHGIPLPPPLNRKECRDRVRKGWNVDKDDFVLLYLGRIVRSKGVLELLRASAHVAQRDSRLRCVLVGSSPGFDETDMLEQAVRETPETADKVRLIPAVNPEQVWEQLCGADLFVFPSHREGMPNSLLEALAMGIPSVAFDIPAVREIEAGGGAPRLVPAFDPRQLSTAILELIHSPAERERLGASGKRRVDQAFNVRRNVSLAIDKLASVVRGDGPSVDAIRAHRFPENASESLSDVSP
jgi:glycosyltransferase involved in cell wall biosynthesis